MQLVRKHDTLPWLKGVFDFPNASGRAERLVLDRPIRIILAHDHSEVPAALAAVEQAQREGCWCAGFVSYDAAPAFDPAFKVQRDPAMPLVCFGIFDHVVKIADCAPAAPPASTWVLDTSRQAFIAGVETLREDIRNGVAYQVNYTLRANATLLGDGFAHYEQLRRAQACNYCAYLECGDWRILSASPELFFRITGDTITTRPMKGTAPRGRWPEEDEGFREGLYRSEKERAENLMIVDLLRNDLARISVSHGVRVSELFKIERYPTLFQMTSTVDAKLRPGIGLVDVFGALFPCGSVTGAPKIKAMERIHDLEASPRGVYCGAIGLLSPNHTTFSVAIRTVVMDTGNGAAVCGLGSGITFDSDPELEFQEVQIKSRFLDVAPEPFELLETLLFDGHDFWLRDRHLERMVRSGLHFGFALDRMRIEQALDTWRLSAPASRVRVRLLVDEKGTPRIEASVLDEAAPEQDPVVVPLAKKPMVRTNPFIFHKTTRREEYERQSNEFPEAFDVLLWNERGEVTEFTRGNVVVEINGKRWTPPLDCGLLGGTFREELLDRGEIAERILSRDDVISARRIWFVNSVRGWVEVMLGDYERLWG